MSQRGLFPITFSGRRLGAFRSLVSGGVVDRTAWWTELRKAASVEMDIRGNWDRISPSPQQWLIDNPCRRPAADHCLHDL